MPQYFKGDELEVKFYNSGADIMDTLSMQKDLFYDGAFETAVLGDLLSETLRAPLANAIDQSIFRSSFKQIFDAFIVAGSFESLITVFKKIFGDDVDIEFLVPGPGLLTINIVATTLVEELFVARDIESNAYVYNPVITQDGNNLVFRTIKGFQTQYELQQMLHELNPAGISTTISLTLG